MPNRTMEVKVLKLQRQLRKLPRPMNDNVPGEFIPDNKAREIPKRLGAAGVVVPRQPNRELMEGYKHRASSLGREEIKGKFKGQCPGRDVAAHMQRIEKVMPEFKEIVILSTRIHKARVLYNTNKTCFMLVYENFKELKVRTSITYMNKMRLIDDFRADRLRWVEIISPPNTREGG